MSGAEETAGVTQPVLRVIRGDATPEEIAAVVAVVAALRAPGEAPAPRRSLWATPRLAGAPASSWRASALPR